MEREDLEDGEIAIGITAADTRGRFCQAGLYPRDPIQETGLTQKSMRITCAEMGNGYYILTEKGEPKLLFSPRTSGLNIRKMAEWGLWLEKHRDKRIVKQEQLGKYWISTVFLPIDHAWGGGPPVLWETMVFVGKGEKYRSVEQERCSGGREQAEAMHARMVTQMRKRAGYLNAKK